MGFLLDELSVSEQLELVSFKENTTFLSTNLEPRLPGPCLVRFYVSQPQDGPPEASYNHQSSGHVEEDGKLWLVVAEVQRTNTRVIARESSPGAVELGFRGTVSEDSGGASQTRFNRARAHASRADFGLISAK